MDILYLFSGLLTGCLVTWLILHFYNKSKNPLNAEEVKILENKKNDFDVSLKLKEGNLNSQAE